MTATKIAAALLVGLISMGAVRRAHAKDRHLAVIIDTSGSMAANDPARLTVQMAKILSDLLDDHDRMIVVRMPDTESCSDGPNGSLSVTFQASRRQEFKAEIDQNIQFRSGTNFAAPVRTGLDFLSQKPAGRRLFLILADAGGFGICDAPLTQELTGLRKSGAEVAAINLGTGGGTFFSNPAFSFTRAANDSRQVIEAVATVYQKFLGSKRVQTGNVSGRVDVTVDELCAEAFLVVAADGKVGDLSSSSQNPGAREEDLNLHGGGQTEGTDNVVRGYRIARLVQPKPGRWLFDAAGLSGTAGYMLLQEYAVELRMVSSVEAPLGRSSRVAFEVLNPRTGKRVENPAALAGVRLHAVVDGKNIELLDTGRGGDERSGDGVFSTEVRFDNEGKVPVVAHLTSDRMDRTVASEVNVIRSSWALASMTPPKVEVDTPVLVSVRVEPADPAAQPPSSPDMVNATGLANLTLRDDGKGGDAKAGDRVYSTLYVPASIGRFEVHFSCAGDHRCAAGVATLDVIGKLVFGPAIPMDLGRVHSESKAETSLDLSGATVKGRFDMEVTSTFSSGGAALEIDTGNGFRLLGSRPVTLVLDDKAPRRLAVRLRTGACPAACAPSETTRVVVSAVDAEGKAISHEVPLRVEVLPDPWLVCYWPFLALLAGLVATGVTAHGFWSPSRFNRRIGVKVSPEEDVEEGVFYTIRAQPGTGSGFYRDAAVYVGRDFRVSGRSRGSIARLRAKGQRVLIRPADGASVFRRNAENEWEELGRDEVPCRFGTLYRDEKGSLYFELRNG